MTDKLNFFAEKVTQQLFEQGLSPEDVLTMFSIGVLTLTPFVHPAGFDINGKIHNMHVESVLAEWLPDKEH